MRFTDIFIRRPVLAVVVSLLILLIGARSLYSLPIRQYPMLSNTVITVTTVYPGASSDLMQGFITQPIAQAVASAEGLDYLTSSSTQNTSTITAYVKLNFDPNKAMTDVMAKVQQVKYLIPREANDPVITKSTGDTTAIMYIGFSSPQLSGAAITDYLSRVVQPLLATVDGVASADILGGQTFAMRVWARSPEDGGPRRDRGRCGAGDPVQQLPVGAGPGQGLFHRHQRHRRHRADESRPVQADDRQGPGRQPGAAAGHRHHRSGRPEHQLLGHDERPGGRVHRRAADAGRQPPHHRQGRARPPADDRARPAADGEDEHRL